MKAKNIAREIFYAIDLAGEECKLARGANKVTVTRARTEITVTLEYKNPKRIETFSIFVMRKQQ